MITEERREFGVDRVPVRRPVAICAGRQGMVVQGETLDLSPRGMQVAVGGSLQAGEHLVFRLDLGPEFSTVVEGGEVAWVVPSGPTTTAGVRFVALPRRPTGKLDPAPSPGKPEFAPGEELRVKVGGMSQALRAEFIDQEGPNLLRFRCPLPFLKLRSPVVVHSVQGTEAVFEGEVGAVDISATENDGVPELVVTVWNGTGEGDGEFVVVGALESAGLPTSSGRPVVRTSPAERSTWTEPAPEDGAPPSAGLPRDTVEIEPLREPEAAGPLAEAPSPKASGGAARVAIPAPAPPATPVEPVELGRRVGAAVSGAGRRSVAVMVGSTRGALGRVGPLLRSFLVLAFGGVRGAVRRVGRLVGGAHRRWRRSRLPQTYSDVVGRRAPRPAKAGGNKLVHRAAVAMGLVGVGLAVWGLFGARDADGKRTGSEPGVAAETSAGAAAPAGADEPLPNVPSAWPSAGELPSAGDAASAGAQDWDVPSAAREEPAPAPERPAAEPERGGDREAATARGGKRFTIKLDGPPLRIRDYALRQPPGIVVDVMGAGPEDASAPIIAGSNAVKLVKSSPRDEGTRFIIYLRARTMPRYTIDPDGNGFAVTLLD
ncbi:MAG: PilZ domain-containing protein [Deltaproteobacteria bacterium]|nr:PilZ domain-containing protein [Deltaproteobacteria bacterium]